MSWFSDLFGGGGGGSTSTSTSWSETIQQDQRVTAEDAELVAGAGAVVSLPSSVAVASQASVGDILIQPYTPEVQKTVSELIESFTFAMGKTAETSMKVTEVLGEKLQETELGVSSMLPDMAKYLLISVVVIVLAWKVLK
jgi:hypothetical protein